jgi:hypothetical protein
MIQLDDDGGLYDPFLEAGGPEWHEPDSDEWEAAFDNE